VVVQLAAAEGRAVDLPAHAAHELVMASRIGGGRARRLVSSR
jgi:hypothetical protein